MLGRQGAGKGTQGVRLARHYVVPHISTGDMFRAAVQDGTEYGRKAKEVMDAGNLVPDEITVGVVRERLHHPDTRRGYLLDGFPRNVDQAAALDDITSAAPLDLVINLDVEVDVVVERIASRRICNDCGAIYSTDRPPKENWTCDHCGGEVVQREDDTEEAVRRRLDVYEKETAPLVDWYGERGLLVTVDGLGTTDEVTERLMAVVDERVAHPTR